MPSETISRPRLLDVARAAGVSRSTAAHALNGSWLKVGLNADTAKAVRQAAARIGYRGNYAAHCVSTGRFNTLAFVISETPWTSSILPGLFGGVIDATMRSGYHLSIVRESDERLTDPGHMPCFLDTWMCDGALMNYQTGAPPQLRALIERSGIPAVWLNSKSDCDCVYPDESGAAIMLTRHLLELGHRQIAYADRGFKPSAALGYRHFSKEDRLDGYCRAMTHAGCPPMPLVDIDDRDDLAINLRALFARKADRPTALICNSMSEFMIAHLAACELGMRIPEDLSLAVFAGSKDTLVLDFGATVVHDPHSELGRQGVAMLLEKLAEPGKIHPALVLPYELVPSRSTGPTPVASATAKRYDPRRCSRSRGHPDEQHAQPAHI